MDNKHADITIQIITSHKIGEKIQEKTHTLRGIIECPIR